MNMKKIGVSFALIYCLCLTAACHSFKKASKHHNDLLDTYQLLQKDLPEAKVSMESDKVKIILPEAILFQVNDDVINKSYDGSFKKMATIFNKYPKTNILITGYTDNTGKEAYNSELSKRRADAAQNILTDNGVEASRIYSWGLGEKNPVADNNTENGRQLNRRVEIVVMYNYKKMSN